MNTQIETIEDKLAYLQILVHLVEVLYVDNVTDNALRQIAKEKTEAILHSIEIPTQA